MKPQRYYRGSRVPPTVLDMVEDGLLSPVELVLYLVIDSLMHPVKGCFASNATLGSKIGKGGSYVKQMLRKLKRHGLVRVIMKDKYTRKMILTVDPDYGNVIGGVGNRLPRGGQPADPRAYNKKLTVAASPAPETPGENGFWDVEDNRPCTPIQMSLAEILKEGLQNKRPECINKKSKVKEWAKEFRLLEEQDRQDPDKVLTILQWYTQYMNSSKYIPVANSGKAFREKFGRIADCYRRWLQDNPIQEDEEFQYGG